MIDTDEVIREVLVEVTGKLPETLGNAVFPVALTASEYVLDTAFAVTELVLLPWRVLGVIR